MSKSVIAPSGPEPYIGTVPTRGEMLRSPLPGPSMGFCACALAVEYATGPVGAGATVFRNSSGVVIAENEPARPVLGGGWLAAGPCPVAPGG